MDARNEHPDELIPIGTAVEMISAQLRKTSRQTVRRLILAGELTEEWTRSPEQFTTDTRGKVMRGHRRLRRSEVEAWIKAEMRRAGGS